MPVRNGITAAWLLSSFKSAASVQAPPESLENAFVFACMQYATDIEDRPASDDDASVQVDIQKSCQERLSKSSTFCTGYTELIARRAGEGELASFCRAEYGRLYNADGHAALQRQKACEEHIKGIGKLHLPSTKLAKVVEMDCVKHFGLTTETCNEVSRLAGVGDVQGACRLALPLEQDTPKGPDMVSICQKTASNVETAGLEGDALQEAAVDLCTSEMQALPQSVQPLAAHIHKGCLFFAKRLAQENPKGSISTASFCSSLTHKKSAAHRGSPSKALLHRGRVAHNERPIHRAPSKFAITAALKPSSPRSTPMTDQKNTKPSSETVVAVASAVESKVSPAVGTTLAPLAAVAATTKPSAASTVIKDFESDEGEIPTETDVVKFSLPVAPKAAQGSADVKPNPPKTAGATVKKVSGAVAKNLLGSTDNAGGAVKLTGWNADARNIVTNHMGNLSQKEVAAAAAEGTLTMDMGSKVVEVMPAKNARNPHAHSIRGAAVRAQLQKTAIEAHVTNASKQISAHLAHAAHQSTAAPVSKSAVASAAKVAPAASHTPSTPTAPPPIVGAHAVQESDAEKQRRQHALDVKHDAEALFGDLDAALGDAPQTNGSVAPAASLVVKPAAQASTTQAAAAFLENSANASNTAAAAGEEGSQNGDFLSDFLGTYDEKLKDDISKVQPDAQAQKAAAVQQDTAPTTASPAKHASASTTARHSAKAADEAPTDSDDNDIDSLVSAFIEKND